MTLRKQLLLVSLCLLTLPWAGCQYVKEMEAVLRHNQQQRVQFAAKPIAQLLAPVISNNLSMFSASEKILYASYRHNPITIDGYNEDWKDYASEELRIHSTAEQHLSKADNYFHIAVNDKNILLFFHVVDNDIIYYNPGSPSPTFSDHIRITTWDQKEKQTIIILSTNNLFKVLN